MIVQLAEEKWIVQWEHFQNIKSTKLYDESQKFVERTYCTLKKLNEDGLILTISRRGVAKCSGRDQFSKNTGRKVSLKRAIKDFKQWERRKFWEAYAEMRNGNF